MNPEFKGKASVEKPWLQYYPEALRNFVPSEDTLADFILKNNPDHNSTCIEFYGKTFTLNEVLAERDKIAKSLVAAGVKEIDHRLAVCVKGHSVVYLHPAGESLVVARLKENEISVCRFNYGFSS